MSIKKIVILNGSPRKHGNTAALVDEVLKVIEGKLVEVKEYHLNTMDIKGCQSCYACREQGGCVLQDDMQKLYDEIQSASGIIFATPVYMWQMTAQLKLFVDRLYPFLKPDYSSYLAPGKKVLMVVTQGRPDTSMFRHYFEHMGKNLLFLGFGSYEILIAGGTSNSNKDFLKQLELLAETKRMGQWLID